MIATTPQPNTKLTSFTFSKHRKAPLSCLRNNLIDPGRDDIIEKLHLEISSFGVGDKEERVAVQSKRKIDMAREWLRWQWNVIASFTSTELLGTRKFNIDKL